MKQAVAVADLAAHFGTTLLAMHECRVAWAENPQHWNGLVNEMQRVHLRLRESEDGRAAITAFIEDACLTVR